MHKNLLKYTYVTKDAVQFPATETLPQASHKEFAIIVPLWSKL